MNATRPLEPSINTPVPSLREQSLTPIHRRPPCCLRDGEVVFQPIQPRNLGDERRLDFQYGRQSGKRPPHQPRSQPQLGSRCLPRFRNSLPGRRFSRRRGGFSKRDKRQYQYARNAARLADGRTQSPDSRGAIRDVYAGVIREGQRQGAFRTVDPRVTRIVLSI